MTRYVYYSRDFETQDLSHIDLPKFPEFKIPKIDLPKINIPKIELPKFQFPNVNDKKSSDSKQSKNLIKRSPINATISKGNKKDREWKNHKWIARKRNKDGKWIYDYGDGFPGENKSKNSKKSKKNSTLGSDRVVNINKNKNFSLKAPSAIEKFVAPFVGLGKALLAPTAEEKIEGGKQFVGSLSQVARNAQSAIRKIGTKTDSKSGLQLKHKDEGKNFDLKAVNPGYDNPDGGAQYNCPCCSVAYDMRRRGYEVTAKETRTGLPGVEEISSFYKDPIVHEVTSDNWNDIQYTPEGVVNTGLTKAAEQAMDSEPNNTRGIICLDWYPGDVGGHVVAYERENNQTYIYDAQSGEKLDLSDYTDRAATFYYYRTDNLEPNYDQIKKVVE